MFLGPAFHFWVAVGLSDITTFPQAQVLAFVGLMFFCLEEKRFFVGPGGFRSALTDHVFPRLRAFAPELIFISAGFDGLATDPLGGALGLTHADYDWATRHLVHIATDVCGGRLISVLEGGYDLDHAPDGGLVQAVHSHVRTLVETTSA